jgi:hypothetical protein
VGTLRFAHPTLATTQGNYLMSKIILKPRFLPRGTLDGLLSLVIGLFQTLIVLGFPFFICRVFTNNTTLSLIVAFVAYIIFLLFSVSNLVIMPDGIHLSRILGSPKFIAWSAISSIEEAPRFELIWRGWLWPIFPAKEMTPSLTSIGHYRIQFGSKSIYFPPEDSEAFKTLVSSYLTDQT